MKPAAKIVNRGRTKREGLVLGMEDREKVICTLNVERGVVRGGGEGCKNKGVAGRYFCKYKE